MCYQSPNMESPPKTSRVASSSLLSLPPPFLPPTFSTSRSRSRSRTWSMCSSGIRSWSRSRSRSLDRGLARSLSRKVFDPTDFDENPYHLRSEAPRTPEPQRVKRQRETMAAAVAALVAREQAAMAAADLRTTWHNDLASIRLAAAERWLLSLLE